MRTKHFCYVCGTRLTKKFFEDQERLYCQHCQYPVYENPIPATAAVVINENHEVLLVKRSVEPKAGQWCLPGGFVEMGETPEDGCLRELHEETGLKGEIHRWAGNILSTSPLYQWVIVMGYQIKNFYGEIKAGDDCSEAIFFKPENLPPIAFQSHRQILKNVLETSENHETLLQGVQGDGFLEKSPPGGRRPKTFGAYVITSGNHTEIAHRACSAGARILQYREKHASRQEMVNTALEIKKITEKHGTTFIVNDYIDIALIVKADGVHLGQDDIPIAEARKIVPPDFLIGRSTHSLEQAIEAELQGADYIGSGPVFATPTKEHYIPIGIDTVKQVIQTVRIPVVAIGGLNVDNIYQLQKIGVKNFAMVREFQANTEEVVGRINRLII